MHNSVILYSIPVAFRRIPRPSIALARKKTDQVAILSMAFKKGSGIINHTFAVFCLEGAKGVHVIEK